MKKILFFFSTQGRFFIITTHYTHIRTCNVDIIRFSDLVLEGFNHPLIRENKTLCIYYYKDKLLNCNFSHFVPLCCILYYLLSIIYICIYMYYTKLLRNILYYLQRCACRYTSVNIFSFILPIFNGEYSSMIITSYFAINYFSTFCSIYAPNSELRSESYIDIMNNIMAIQCNIYNTFYIIDNLGSDKFIVTEE